MALQISHVLEAILDTSAEFVAAFTREADQTRQPAVLIECAFVSNPGEARLLGDDLDGFKERLAVALFKGLRVALLGKPEQAAP